MIYHYSAIIKTFLTVDMSSLSEDNKPEDEPSDTDDDGPSKPKRCKMLELLFVDESNSGPIKKEKKDTNKPPKKSSNAASTSNQYTKTAKKLKNPVKSGSKRDSKLKQKKNRKSKDKKVKNTVKSGSKRESKLKQKKNKKSNLRSPNLKKNLTDIEPEK